MVEYKYCNKCGLVKTPDEFYVDRSKSDGHRTICKDCDNKDRMTPFEALKTMLQGNWIFDVYEDDIVGESLNIVDNDNFITVYSENEGEEIAIEVSKYGFGTSKELIHFKHYVRPVAAFNFINSIMTRD